MYQKLLISAGGGILSRDQQAEQDECATIAIGLGGTGISCLRTLKKEIYTRVQPDEAENMLARYRHIKFLAVDTDQTSIGDTGAVDTLDGNTEFFNISCSDIEGLLRNAHILMQKPSLKWLKARNTQNGGSEIEIMDAEAGAGGVRQIGRLLLLQNCSAFVRKLTSLITEARTGLMKSSYINIHIFTGMSGGTGAGTFLDVCYLVQYVLDKLGWTGQSHTCGYFFLTDVNKAGGVNKDYMPVNGFAAMKELDYCMNFANNGGEWNQEYDGFSIRTNAPPVKLAHLVTATDARGRVRENGYEYAMHVVADYVLEYIIRPFVSEREEAANEGVFSIRSHIANVLLDINMVKKEHGACYNYCVLGAANAYLPYREITTYLTSKIFEGFRDLARQIPSETEVNAFIEENGLEYSRVFRNLTARLPSVPNQEVDWRTLYDQVNGMQLSDIPGSLKKMRDAIPSIAAKLQENSRVLLDTDPVRSADAEQRVLSLSLRVRGALEQIAAQASRGPYYASNLLRSPTSADLIGKVREDSLRNSEELKRARAQLNELDEKRETALKAFQQSLFIVRNRRAREYFQAELKRFQQQDRIRRLEAMGSLLQEFQTQLESLHRSFFGRFEEVMKTLQATFDANLSALSNPTAFHNGYAVRLIRVQDLKRSLDQSVESMKLETQVHDFVSEMMRRPESWITSDENKLCEAVTRYFLEQLSDFTRRTIVDYLRIKFGTTTPAMLRDRIYNEIILDLDKRAYPLFWTESFYDITGAKAMGYLSIPNISEEIRGAAEAFRSASEEIRIRASWSSDRITLYRFVCGVPLFGYKGVSTYRQDYRTTPIAGSHIYEGSAGDPRDSRTLVDIAPLSCIPEEEYTDTMRDNLRRYEQAWQSGLLEKIPVGNTAEYRLHLLDADAIRAWTGQGRSAADRKDADAAQALLQDPAAQGTPPRTGFRVIPNNGVAALADLVVRDHVTGSLCYMGLIRDGETLLAELDGVKKELLALVGDRNRWREDLNAFARGLVSGAVFQDGNPYTYSWLQDAVTEERVPLTTTASEPFGVDLPLYSAFLGFRELDSAQKAVIVQTVNRNLTSRPDAVRQARADLAAALRDAQLQMRSVKVSHPEEYARALEVFRNLKARVGGEGGDAS